MLLLEFKNDNETCERGWCETTCSFPPLQKKQKGIMCCFLKIINDDEVNSRRTEKHWKSVSVGKSSLNKYQFRRYLFNNKNY